MDALDYLLAGIAAFGAGLVNAVAGGGTLISFPTLVALGIPSVSANVTNTVALCPGYLGGAHAQRSALEGQRPRVRRLAIAAAVGGLTGSVLLVLTSDEVFSTLVPILLFGATMLLAAQDRLRRVLRIGVATAASDGTKVAPDPRWLPLTVFAVSIYGGYFGAGLGIMLLAVLGLVVHEPLGRLNALKQLLAVVINVTAAAFFVTSGKVWWIVAAVMAVTSLVGGHTGGRLAGRLDPRRLRTLVVSIGLAVSIVYAVRSWSP